MKKRPIGITILAILSFIGGIGLLIIQGVFAEQLGIAMGSLGYSRSAAVVNMLVLGVWAILAGVGLWQGRKWGWWLGALYLSYSVLRSLNAAISISDFASQFPDQSVDTTKYYIKYCGRAAIHSLIVVYYYKNNVLEFFSLGTDRKMRRFARFAGITFSVYLVMALVSLVL